MINTVMLVGRLVRDPEIIETENGNKVSKITLAINRPFKNTDGIYDADFIDCVLWNTFAKNVSTYCTKGDLLGVRGRVKVDSYEKDDVKRKVIEVVAEKITFMSSSSKVKEGTEISDEN